MLLVLLWLAVRAIDRRLREFPPSGSVMVSSQIEPGAATARLALVGSKTFAIVQLLDAQSRIHVLSVYMRPGEVRLVPVPPGTFRIRTLSGNAWYGPQRLFGPSTRVSLAASPITFTPGHRTAITIPSAARGSTKRRGS